MEIIDKIKRALKKPPKYILFRVINEAKISADRLFNSRPDKRLSLEKFLRIAKAETIDILWERHREIPFALNISNFQDIESYKINFPDSVRTILAKADAVLNGNINLLGTGEINFGTKLCWNKDYKSGISWANKYYRDISYVNFNNSSDVKIPWEISRMQWMIPLGQAYLLTKDEKYAIYVKEKINDWINDNVYAHSVNWTCTMEVALRIITWEWFFYVFAQSQAWSSNEFRFLFLKALYLHSFFTERNLEKSDVNGNHYTADGAGLVFAGVFFKGYDLSENFLNLGLEILTSEIELQIYPDGVDYEASVPYHRLVTELFFYPALLLKNAGYKTVSQIYVDKIIRMAYFIKAYTRYNATVPLFGDADDARTLPMGLQSINDHDYLASLIGLTYNEVELVSGSPSTKDEIFWTLGFGYLNNLPAPDNKYFTKAFKEGGFYIMGNKDCHVFIDCGPIGLANRGGHGHNDLLSFDALIQGEHIITDCGAYLYTADYKERNSFRSTSYHNTPKIDGEEINRFISPTYLWNFKNDAAHSLVRWEIKDNLDIFIGSHSGYMRLNEPVTPIRKVILKKDKSELLISDIISGSGVHTAEIPLHFYPGVKILNISSKCLDIISGTKLFKLFWQGDGWYVRLETCRVSPSYGVVLDASKIVWYNNNAVDKRLTLFITSENSESYARNAMDELIQI